MLEAGVEPPPGSLQRRSCPLRANGSRVGHGPSEAQRTGPGVIRERGEEATPGLAGLLQRGKRQHRGHESPGDPPGPRWSDAVEELQEPEPGQLVVGVLRQP